VTMGRGLVTGVALLCACNAKLGAIPSGDGPLPIDSRLPPDTPVVDSAPTWATPNSIAGANDAVLIEDDCTLDSTATELIYSVVDPAGTTGKDLYVMTRASTQVPFSNPQPLTIFNTTLTEESPRLTPDNLTLYFGRGGDIFMSQRSAVGAAWGAPVAVT